MKPQRDRRGKSTINDARMPGDLELRTSKGFVVVAGPVYGAWDVDADDATRIFSAGRLLGRDRDASDTNRDASDRPDDGRSSALDAHRDGATVPAAQAHGAEAGLRAGVDSTAAGRDEHTRPAQRRLTKTEIKIRRQTQAALALRAEGWSVDDIAAHFGVSRPTITGWFVAHRRQVTLEEIDSVLDQTAIPLATENLIHGLLEGDKDYTLEVLKGRGALRRHGESDKQPTGGLPELRIVFEAPVSGPLPITAAGTVTGNVAIPKQVGSGSTLDTEVAHGTGTGIVQVPRAAQSAEGAGQ